MNKFYEEFQRWAWDTFCNIPLLELEKENFVTKYELTFHMLLILACRIEETLSERSNVVRLHNSSFGIDYADYGIYSKLSRGKKERHVVRAHWFDLYGMGRSEILANKGSFKDAKEETIELLLMLADEEEHKHKAELNK
jgi:hypothetical protein